MKVKKVAAGAIMTVALPVLVDVAADPYADRGVARSWCRGAAVLAGALVLTWSARELGMEAVPRETDA